MNDEIDNWLDSDAFLNETAESASSQEDFWMFFSFSMLILVFLLTSYVNYLNAIDIQPVIPDEPVETTAEAFSNADSISIGVREKNGFVYYTVGENSKKLNLSSLRDVLQKKMNDYKNSAKLNINIHASGEQLYRDVFNASYVVQTIESPNAKFKLNVRQIYEQK